MANNLEMAAFKFGNILYKYAFPVYKPLYFLYKKSSDRKKIEYLKNTIKPGMTILDIGANIGFYTSLFSELTGANGKVYAFEPDKTNFRHLEKLTSKYSNITIENSAVGDKTQMIKLYYSKNLNVDHQTYDTGENRNYSEVNCIALDDYFSENEKADFIKIDIQGYDYFAVAGMKKTIERSEKVMIFGEFWPYGLKKAGVDHNHYIALLKDLGLNLKFFCSEEDVSNFDKKTDDWNFTTDFWGYK